MKMPKEFNIIELFLNIALASFGGIVKRLSDLEKNPDKMPSLAYYITGAFISLFVGIVVFFICKHFNVPQFLTAGLTALSGYLGTPVLDWLGDVAKKRLEKEAKK